MINSLYEHDFIKTFQKDHSDECWVWNITYELFLNFIYAENKNVKLAAQSKIQANKMNGEKEQRIILQETIKMIFGG